MNDLLLPVVVVHGVGSGTNQNRAGFSRDLSTQVHAHERPVIRVGLCEHSAPNPLPDNSILWEEALWESVNDTADAISAAAIQTIIPCAPAGWPAAGIIDIVNDVPLYLRSHGHAIRMVVREVIAKHPHCVLVAHSLGSVIAADILREAQYIDNFASLPVSGFVTIGSPLSILGLRSPMTTPFGFTWKNLFYPTDPVCHGNGLPSSHFPGVFNQQLSGGETFGVSHTSYWSSSVLAGMVYRLSKKGSK